MTEAISDERISAYLDDELSPSEREAFAAALESDAALREAVRELEALRARFAAFAPSEAPAGLEARVLAQITALNTPPVPSTSRTVKSRSGRDTRVLDWRIWATIAAALLAALGIWAYQVNGDRGDGPPIVHYDPIESTETLPEDRVAEAEADESNKVAPRDPSVDQVIAQLQQREQSVVLVELLGAPVENALTTYLESEGVEFEPANVVELEAPVEVIYVTATPKRMAWILQNLTRVPARETRVPFRSVLKDAESGKSPRLVFERYLTRDSVEVDRTLLETLQAGQLMASDIANEPQGTALRVSPRQLDTLVRLDRLRERHRNRAMEAGEAWQPELAVVFVTATPQR